MKKHKKDTILAISAAFSGVNFSLPADTYGKITAVTALGKIHRSCAKPELKE